MSSPCDPQYAPAGDVDAALMMIDSRLKAIYADIAGRPAARNRPSRHDGSGEAAPGAVPERMT